MNMPKVDIQPQFNLLANMPPAVIFPKNKLHANVPPVVIHPKNLKDPEDVVTNEDSDDEDVGNDTAEVSEDEDDEDADLAGIQGLLNLDVSDDEDAEDIDPESIHRRAYNMRDAVQWINKNEEGSVGFNKIFNEAGKGNMKLGEKLVLQKVIKGTNISASEHIKLLINRQMKQVESVGTFGCRDFVSRSI